MPKATGKGTIDMWCRRLAVILVAITIVAMPTLAEAGPVTAFIKVVAKAADVLAYTLRSAVRDWPPGVGRLPEPPPAEEPSPERSPGVGRLPEPSPAVRSCRPQRNCIPKIVLSDDGHMTLSLECGGEKISMKFPVSSVDHRRVNDWSEDSSPERDFSADWQRTFSLGCGALTLDMSLVSGKVKGTAFGSLSIDSDGRVTLSATQGDVGFEVLVEAETVSAPAREAWDALLFWYSVSNDTSLAESAVYLEQFPTEMFTKLAQIRLVELRPARELTPGDVPAPDLAIGATEVREIKLGGSADVILAEWVNARNGEKMQ